MSTSTSATTPEPTGVQGIRVRRDKGIEPIRRDALQDCTLSFKARGILGYLLSLPENWRTDSHRLAAASPREGRDAIRSGLAELDDAGYLHREKVRVQGGVYRWVWLYADDPAELAERAADVIAEVSAGVTQTRAANQQPDLFSQVTPETGYPASVEPTSDEPTTGEPTSGNPASYKDTPERSPLPHERRTDHPPAPASGGAAASRSSTRGCRADGTNPRAVAAQARRGDLAAARRDRDTAAAVVRAEVADCDLCDDRGYRLDAQTSPCRHDPAQGETNARGMAAVREAMAGTRRPG